MGDVRQGSTPSRWPVIAASLLAVALFALVMPSALFTPDPPDVGTARYAPIPGTPPSRESANFARVSRARTEGIGASIELGSTTRAALKEHPLFAPRQKNCVGDPPRQTEDPLSPPCVPFFDGDNGGATSAGVSRDSIDVIVTSDYVTREVDLTKPWKPSDESAVQPNRRAEAQDLIRTMKAHLRYFNDRYQTYGREVRMIAVPGNRGIKGYGCGDARLRGQVIARRAPFSSLYFGYWGFPECFRSPVLDAGIAVFGLNYWTARDDYLDHAPLLWGIYPDQETMAAQSASFLCKTLRDGKAHSPYPTLDGLPRRFGLVRPQPSPDASYADWGGFAADRTIDLLVEQMRARCGMTFDLERYYTAGGPSAQEALDTATAFKQAGITTVVCGACFENWMQFQNPATSIRYFPEWFLDNPSIVGEFIRAFASPDHTMIGIVPRWRLPAWREQHHYLAYLEQEPGTSPSPLSSEVYHTFLSLFSGIQAAGPNLTTESLRDGMYTLSYVNRTNPWTPTGGYGAYGPHTHGPYAFIDTYMGFRWDPEGVPPGGRAGDGCMRLMNGGMRYYPDQWPGDDAAVFAQDAPCTQGDYVLDPAP